METRLLIGLLFVFAAFMVACETKEETSPKAENEATERATTDPEEVPEDDPAPDEDPEPAAEAPPPTSRMDGTEIADGKAYANPDEPAVGTLPEGVGLAVGSSVPAFSALDVNQDPPVEVTRDDLVAQGPILMVFYRGGW